MTVVGRHGGKVRSDVRVTVMDAPKPSFTVQTSVETMYGRAIRRQIEEALTQFGDPPVGIVVEDSGALPFALAARLEAALCAHLGLALPRLESRPFDAPRERPRRTRLYLPGDEPKMFANAPLYGADMLVLDLEDSVAPDCKFAARAMVRHALRTLDWGSCERVLRIGSIDDLSVVPYGVQTVLVPKAESAAQIREIAAKLDELDVPTNVIPLIESAKGILAAADIAAASPRVAAITIGLEDYVRDLGAERTEAGAESAYALGALVNAARAAGVAPLASVYPQADDPEATYAYARRMRALGFEGIGCIHPRQVRPTHRAFAPDEKELAKARAIVLAYEEGLKDGKGAVAVGGRMVDAPVYQRARKLMESASE